MCVFHPKLGNNHFTAIVCRNFNNFDKISLNLHILVEDYTWVNGYVHRKRLYSVLYTKCTMDNKYRANKVETTQRLFVVRNMQLFDESIIRVKHVLNA